MISVSELRTTGGWKKDRDLLNDYPGRVNEKLTCRLIAVKLENGDTEVLCTSLTDTATYLTEDFADLYHHRWNIEEAYKLLKSRIELENFSGKTATSVRQDFYAKVFMMSLCATLAFPLEEKVRKECEEQKNKHHRKINRTSALSNLKDLWVQVYLKDNVKKALKAFDDIVSKTTEIIRPGRSVKRKHAPKKQYSMNYKRL